MSKSRGIREVACVDVRAGGGEGHQHNCSAGIEPLSFTARPAYPRAYLRSDVDSGPGLYDRDACGVKVLAADFPKP
jgi:hypothetical protein